MLRQITTIFVAFLVWLCIGIEVTSARQFEPDSLFKSVTGSPRNCVEAHHPTLYGLFYKQFGVQLTEQDPLELFSFVSRWLRVPYRYGGLSRRGVDCQGFVRLIYDSLFCQKLPAGAGNQFFVCETISKDSLQAGDLVFFRIGTRHISHVGIYLKDGWFAHATVSGIGVVMSRLDAPYYRRWFFKAGRVKLTPELALSLS
jgi:lipoprotein Spr